LKREARKMITSQLLYWITRLDYLREFLFVVIVLGGMFGGLTALWGIMKNEFQRCKKTVFFFFGIIFIMGLIVSLTPTTKEMAFILVAPKIVNSETVQELPNDLKNLKELGMDYLKSKLER